MVGMVRLLDNVMHAYEREYGSPPAAFIIGRNDFPWLLKEVEELTFMTIETTEPQVTRYCDIPVMCVDLATGCFGVGQQLLRQMVATGMARKP